MKFLVSELGISYAFLSACESMKKTMYSKKILVNVTMNVDHFLKRFPHAFFVFVYPRVSGNILYIHMSI